MVVGGMTFFFFFFYKFIKSGLSISTHCATHTYVLSITRTNSISRFFCLLIQLCSLRHLTTTHTLSLSLLAALGFFIPPSPRNKKMFFTFVFYYPPLLYVDAFLNGMKKIEYWSQRLQSLKEGVLAKQHQAALSGNPAPRGVKRTTTRPRNAHMVGGWGD